MANKKKPDKVMVCDDCLNAVYDELGSTDVDQTLIAMQAGDVLPDHICEEVEHNAKYGQCACSCKRHAKMKIRTRKEHWTVEAVTGEGKTEIISTFVIDALKEDEDDRKVGEFW
jgi:hypothetical protein